MRMLIVDDDEISRSILERMLLEWGFEVVTADNGADAWELFQQDPVKFIIADWIMPGFDGVELCRRVRSFEHAGYVYFLLLTGKDRKEDIVVGLDAGADDYVTKPFDRDELKVRVRVGERVLNLERELTERTDRLVALNAKLEQLACMDPLMSIGNRRHFHETVSKLYHRSKRYGQDFGLVISDVDYFKNYNDTYGHLAGDQVLRRVASAIVQALRSSDEVFRYGGEEIVMLLPEQGRDGARIVAEKIRAAVSALNIEHSGSILGKLTISCGVSAFSGDDPAPGWEEIVSDADRALYEAKQKGRNRVCG